MGRRGSLRTPYIPSQLAQWSSVSMSGFRQAVYDLGALIDGQIKIS